MDSLLAYGSSDDEQDDEPQKPHLHLHLHPQPTSAKSQDLPKPSSLFSILPPPRSQMTTPLSSNPNPNPDPKRVVQFRPPQILISSKDEDDPDDEEEKEKEPPKRQLGHGTSVKSFLSTIPAPKNSGTAALGSSAGRRAVIDTPAPVAANEVVDGALGSRQESSSNVDVGSSDGYNYDLRYGGAESYGVGSPEYGGYQSYEQQSYDGSNNSWNFDSGTVYSGGIGPESSSGGDFIGMSGGKRRRDQFPAEIVEVKQDELLKNRPTEDKSKLTGIAFGPSYQPASSKGKPSKLSKRKHQISSLYFDMKQKEMELSERRAKGFLTKAETQAKYGW